ncbi:exonuclease subunit SbcC [Crocosphaera sp.]|uniref:exonuclease subunit SbcC n=1 Tax=Crocosphaera sp. TaxID=2729996 RepID=UPI0026036001|nr:exonuclease subunit SbcC [Crocosphaera sp.]MDJ0579157.1 exonuclease subunit SbcC [Crocosphaera sp.]
MIPLQLTLKNFLSYRDIILDFRGLHTACICGANGAGKSSLLEAITWVIWGKSRTATDEDIIHTTAAYVRVDFEFICYEQSYRIIRSRQRGKSNTLDFQINSGDEFISLSGKGVRATQDIIIATLKLDYETFINSAYLRQGRADEFMLRGATDRKKVLAELLKLEEYQKLAEKAKDLSKQYKGQVEQIKLNLDRINQQIEERKNINTQQKVINEEIEKLQNLQQADQHKLQIIKQKNNHRQAWLEQFTWHQNKQQNLVKEAHKLNKESGELANKINNSETMISQEQEITEKYEELLILQKQEETLSHQFQISQELQQERQKIEQEIFKKNNQLQLQIRQEKTRLEQLEENERELQKIISQSKEIKAAVEKLNNHRQRLQELDKLQHKVTPLLKQKQNLETELAKIKANLEAKLEQFENLEAQYNQELKKIPERRQLLLELDSQIQEIDNQKVYQIRVKEKSQERKLKQEKLIVNQRNYTEKIDELQQKINLLNNPDSACPLCEQELDESRRHNVVDKTHQQQQRLQEQIWFLQEELSVIKRDIKSLTIEDKQLENKLKNSESIQQDFSRIEAQLDQAGEVKIKSKKLQKEKESIENLIQTETYGMDIQNDIKTISKRLEELNYDEQSHGLARGEVDRLRWAEIKQARIEDAIRNQKKIAQKKPEIINKIEKLETEIKKLETDSELRQKIDKIEGELNNLNYDRAYHQRISSYIRKSQSCVVDYQKLQDIKQQYPQLKEQLETVTNKINNNQEEKKDTEKFIQQLSTQLETIEDYTEEIERLETQLKLERKKLDNLLGKKGRIEQSLSQLESFKKDQEEQEKQYKNIRKKYRVYTELTQAFSKNGIQLLMIENVLPQLEAETNQILSRLTGNQFHIRFVTQRAGKSGSSRKKSAKMIDTLDIIISDTKGSRAYETYSGGEAFRINFSVRLALAKLLAQRAGTTLQMLIIDEGFGTQDAEGCERLIAAINAISSDFSCILAVTHMPRFQEAFQHRIEVYKTNQGSKINLVS